jgi:hypothetical protein
MIRVARIAFAFALISPLTTLPNLEANHGHGGGGGGHAGGGHVSGGHVGGGFSGGHVSGAQHFGGTQHMSGVQHFGGVQHQAIQGGVTHSQGIQHNGFQQGTMHNGVIHNGVIHQNALSGTTGHQFQSQNSGFQHFNLNTPQHQLHSPFYQNHGLQQQHQVLTTTGSNSYQSRVHGLSNGNSIHQGSQFLQHHGLATTRAAGLMTTSMHNHSGNTTGTLNSSFLSQHHQSPNSAIAHHGLNGNSSLTNGMQFGGHHSGSVLNGNRHTGTNNVGAYVHNNLTQNYYYRHNHLGGAGYGGMGYRYRYGGYPGYYGGYGGFYGGYYGGYGFYPSYLGFGLGLGGLGFGLGGYGLGYGYGIGSYGYGFGYPCFVYQPVCAYQPYGYGYSGYGYGGFGYPNYGSVGYSNLGYGPYASLGSTGYSNSAYGYGMGYSAAAPANPGTVLPSASTSTPNPGGSAASTQVASGDSASGIIAALPTTAEYAQIGETAFKGRDYKGAVRAWRHGLLDDPENGVLVLMLAQGLFATEQFNEAAGATQLGMNLVPKDKWEIVVKHYRELYGKVEDYTTQLRVLEKAAKEKTDDPALRFLLGYHYAFLGYPKEAAQQLEKCVLLAPQDEMAQKLLSLVNEKLPKKEDAPAPGLPADATSTLPPLNPAAIPPAPAASDKPAGEANKPPATDATKPDNNGT